MGLLWMIKIILIILICTLDMVGSRVGSAERYVKHANESISIEYARYRALLCGMVIMDFE